jgi:hypothetical protein
MTAIQSSERHPPEETPDLFSAGTALAAGLSSRPPIQAVVY